MNTPTLNNGIFFRDTSFSVNSHVEANHLLSMIKCDSATDLGVVDLWAMSRKVDAPLYQMASFKGKNIKEVNDPRGQFKWQVPVVQDLPFIVDDISGVDRPGIDGQKFDIKINRRAFGYGAVISFSKYSGVELYVVPEEESKIEPHGDGWKYTVQLVNNDNVRYLDKRYLKAGEKVFRMTSVKGEHTRSWDDIGVVESGYREYYQYVGRGEAHSHYSVTKNAQLISDNGVMSDGGLKVVEVWRSFDSQIGADPSIVNLDTLANKMGSAYVKDAIASKSLVKGWIPAMESAHIMKIAKDIENYLFWGTGGRVGTGREDIRMSVGLWPQLDSYYQKVYSKSQYTLDMFETEIFNFFNGRENFDGPDSGKNIIIQTGRAGLKQASKAIGELAFRQGLVVNATEIGAITRKGLDLNFGFAFTSFDIPYLANLKFVLNPALDPVYDSDIDNPKIDGFRLSSYSYLIFDITEMANDNIYLLRNSIYDQGLNWFVKEGTMTYMGRQKSGFSGDPTVSGYSVYMQQTMPAIWVKDPSRVLRLVMRNPLTGAGFGMAANALRA